MMDDIVKLLEKYSVEMNKNYHFYMSGSIPEKIVDNAINKYAPSVRKDSIIGIYDTTLLGNGKGGYLFTDKEFYYTGFLEKTKPVLYGNIKDVLTIKHNEKSSSDDLLIITLLNGEIVRIFDPSVNMSGLKDFLNEVLLLGGISDEKDSKTKEEITNKVEKVSEGKVDNDFSPKRDDIKDNKKDDTIDSEKSDKEKIDLIEKYANSIKGSFSFYTSSYIPEKILSNAINKYANNVNKESVIGLCDTTLFNSGKEGFLFTYDEFYYTETFEKPKPIRYDSIKTIDAMSNDTQSAKSNMLYITLRNGNAVFINNSLINIDSLCQFLEEMALLVNKDFVAKPNKKNKNNNVGKSVSQNNLTKPAPSTKKNDSNNKNKIIKNHEKNNNIIKKEEKTSLSDYVQGNEEIIKMMDKYAPSIGVSCNAYSMNNLPSDKVSNAINKYANGANKELVIGLCDISATGDGGSGILFTEKGFYYSKAKKQIQYEQINGFMDIGDRLRIKLKSGKSIEIQESLINNKELKNYLNAAQFLSGKSGQRIKRKMQKISPINNKKDDNKKERNNGGENNSSQSGKKNDISTGSNVKREKGRENIDIKYKANKNEFSESAGISVGTFSKDYGIISKLSAEEVFNARQGHGYAAERANNLYDKLTGHDARIVGDNLVKNGPDRIVDGIQIQSKYCRTGRDCINECFDENGFKYWVDGKIGGKPMQIEVPPENYDDAVRTMEERIKAGNMQNHTDPNEARDMVIKGHFSRKQTLNIAKAGTVESITYDAVNGAIIATSAFGITSVLTFATCMWKGDGIQKSLKLATYSGLKVGTTTFITTILASQLSKSALNTALKGSSEAIVNAMGPKAAKLIGNAFRNVESVGYVSGATAASNAAKIVRSSMITASVTIVVLSSFDIANMFKGRISGKQLFKNVAGTVTSVAGGTAGWVAGAAIGSAIIPGLGTVVGGLVGSFVAGGAAQKATNAVLGVFIEDDAEEMVRIIQKEFKVLAEDYLLNQKEGEVIVDKLSKKIDGYKLKDMFASSDRRQFARDLIVPIIEKEVKKRKFVKIFSYEQIASSLREVLEEISDNEEQSDSA